MKIFTIGFTKKSAAQFFSILLNSGAKRIVDVRLNNVSQLAGFAKRDDLKYFLREICGMDYVHEPLLAPTQDLLDEVRKKKIGWPDYERRLGKLIRARHIEKFSRSMLNNSCLLCAEDRPDHCHRRVIAEYLRQHWNGVKIIHL
jgi:uncharacterized protein (DUF488 family)